MAACARCSSMNGTSDRDAVRLQILGPALEQWLGLAAAKGDAHALADANRGGELGSLNTEGIEMV